MARGHSTQVTTKEFRKGQAAAVSLNDQRCTPNWELLGRAKSAEFVAGLRYEWDMMARLGLINSTEES